MRNINGAIIFEDCLAASFKIKHTPAKSAIPFLVFYPREMKIHVPQKTCPEMFIAGLFVIPWIWRESKREWINNYDTRIQRNTIQS